MFLDWGTILAGMREISSHNHIEPQNGKSQRDREEEKKRVRQQSVT